jgi:hypothetical protein
LLATLLALLPVLVEALEKRAVVQFLGAGFIHYYDVEASECCLMLAKRLAYYAFQAISCYRFRAVFFGYCHTESGVRFPRGPVQDREALITAAARLAEYAAVGFFVGEAAVLAERKSQRDRSVACRAERWCPASSCETTASAARGLWRDDASTRDVRLS